MSFVVGLDLKVTKPEESRQNILFSEEIFCARTNPVVKNTLKICAQIHQVAKTSLKVCCMIQLPKTKRSQNLCMINPVAKQSSQINAASCCFAILFSDSFDSQFIFLLRPPFCTTYSKKQIFHTECEWGLIKLEDSGFLGFTKPCLQMVVMVLAHN